METNDELVDYLHARGHIESDKVEEAFRKVDRADFVERSPYVDRPVKMSEGPTVSAPHIVAQMLELLEPEGRVLEMGSGSGYVLALLTHLCDEVVGVERIESLVNKSRERVPEAEVLLDYRPPKEDFDRVLYSFAAPEIKIKEALERTDADILVAPVEEGSRQALKKYTREDESVEAYVRFVPWKEGVRTE